MSEFSNPPVFIRQVPPFFWETVYFRNLADIFRYVEYPLQNACQDLWRKNIFTTWSSANQEDIMARLIIDWKTLSDANKEIVRVNNLISGRNLVEILLPITPDLSVTEVQDFFTQKACLFRPQKLKWGSFTIQDADSSFDIYDLSPEEAIKHIVSLGNYYDAEQQLFWISEELYRKSLEKVGSIKEL